MILIQGMGVGADGWLLQIDALASHYRCVSFDNRGYGSSVPVAGKLTIEMMADDVLALMTAQGWTSAHLVGHSIGGLIALYAAQRAPERAVSPSIIMQQFRATRAADATNQPKKCSHFGGQRGA